MASLDPEKRRSNGMLRLLAVVLLVAALATAFYSLYDWQQRKVDDLNRQVTDLTAQLEFAKQQIQQPEDVYTYTSQKGVTVKVYWPTSGTKVVSPTVVIGEVPGNWSFEASFPVQLKDSKGNVIAQAPAQLFGDWMTDRLVPFLVKFDYPSTVSGNGTLLLIKDNPSGLPANDDVVYVPVKL